MEKSKEEQLKAILNKTLSNEEIEEKLKKEVKKKNKTIIKEKQQQRKKIFNILLYSVIALALILQIIVIYLLIKDLSKEEEKISSSKVNNITENNKKKTNSKEKIVIKEKIVVKIEDLSKNNFKKFYNSNKYNTLKCYKYKQGETNLDKTCKKSIEKFLVDNKKALRFEITSVIGESDYIVFNKLEKNIQNLDKKYKNKIKEYLLKGLSTKRALEVYWDIKDKLGKDTIITSPNYYVVSKKNNRGVIIKAYY